jgi:hypothetical protein
MAPEILVATTSIAAVPVKGSQNRRVFRFGAAAANSCS